MKFIGSSLFAFWFLIAGINAQNIIADKIVAKIDNHIILKSEVEASFLQMKSSGEPMGPNAKCEVLEQLVINKVLVAKAEIDSVEVDDSQIEAQMDRRMEYFVRLYGSQEKMEKVLGASVVDLRSDLRDQVKEQLMMQTMQQQLMAKVKVTPSEVKRYFVSIPKDSIPFLPAEAQVGQIVLFPEVSKSEVLKVEQKLLGIKQQIIDGEDFEKLARTYSEDYGSAKQGGDLGWHGRGELVPEFEEICLTIEPGEIADPIESEFGLHLIQLLERVGSRFRARHILIRPTSTYDDVKQSLLKMDSIRTLIMADSMSFEKAAQEFSDDQQTRSNAGYFKDRNTGSSLVPTDMLEPNVFFTVDSMKVGSYSKPVEFRTEEGKKAVRMIFYKKYIPPHYANLKDDYQKLYAATSNNKKGDVLKKWLKGAVKDVFIDIDSEFSSCSLLNDLQ